MAESVKEVEGEVEPRTLEITFEDNLKYELSQEGDLEATLPGKFCARFTCRTAETKENPFKACAKCSTSYCSRECQVSHWKVSHKAECEMVKKVVNGESLAPLTETILKRQLQRVEAYICPYAVSKFERLGKGLVFIRSSSSLKDWIYQEPVNSDGKLLNRHLQVQYLTLPEFDGLAFEDNFELAVVRPELEHLIESYDPKEHIVVFLLLQCGYLACGKMIMKPRYIVSQMLGKSYEYADKEVIQLNFDTQD